MKNKRAILIPAILALGFIPLFCHEISYNSGFSQFVWYPDGYSDKSELFLVCKMIAITVVGILMTVILFRQRYIKHESLRFEKSFILMFIYIIFVLISAALSKYGYWVVFGSEGRFESILVLLSYMVFCYYTYNYVQEESQIKALLGWSSIGMLLITLIGIFQYLGLDIFGTQLGRFLVLKPSHWFDKDYIRMTAKAAYSTLANMNYLSFYFGIVIPLLACLIIGAKKRSHRIILIIVEALSIFCLYAADNLSGWLALAISTVIVTLVLFSRRKKLFITGLVAYAVALICCILICYLVPAIGSKVSYAFLGTTKESTAFNLQSIETKDDEIILTIQGNELHVTYDYDEENTLLSIVCKDADGVQLECHVTDAAPTTQIINDSAYLGCSISPLQLGSSIGITISLDDYDWYFIKGDDGTYYYINDAGKLEKYTTYVGYEIFNWDAMSGRGQIWNHTIPLLRNYILYGVGANCFTFVYPQNEYITNAYSGVPGLYDVKPHSWYLQQWVETGLIGFLALLGFYLWYMVRCIKIYRKADLHESLSWIGIGIFAGTLTYMIVGLANDSFVCTAPPFWVSLGLGMSVNRMIEEKKK